MRILSYADLPAMAGEDLGFSNWFEITQERINLFAEAAGDHQWIHVDPERAGREMGGPIAHGALIFSLIPLLRSSTFEVRGQARIINYGSNRVRFIAPVRVGGQVKLRSKLLGAIPKSGGVLATFENVIERRDEEHPACLAETLSLFLPD